jgi:hypothetical protein
MDKRMSQFSRLAFLNRTVKALLSVRALFVFLAIFVGSVFVYPTSFVQWGMIVLAEKFDAGSTIVKTAQSVYDPLVNVMGIAEENELLGVYFDLKLSVADLEHLEERINYFANLGFIRDDENNWRGAKVYLNGKYQDVKFKLHGTDVASIISSRNILEKAWLRLVYNWPSLKNLIDIKASIQTPGYSIKIKHKLESDLYNFMREYHFKSPVDSANIETIAINTMAQEFGLIAPTSQLNIVRINGIELGLYTFQESPSKEYFERKYGIVNYSLIKTNDDWNRRQAHITDYDTWVENQEISTRGYQSNTALNSLDVLFNAVKDKRVDIIKRLVDVNYMAKFLALHSVMNDNHPISGDNMKFVYDLSKGKFKIIFREEATLVRIERGVDKFNEELFYEVSKIVPAWDLFKLLISDTEFRKIRDRALFDIVKGKESYITLFRQALDQNQAAISAFGKRTTSNAYVIEKLIKDFDINVEHVRLYLNYNKVFVTERSAVNQTKKLTIINDSFTETILEKVIYSNGSADVIEEKVNFVFPGISFDAELNKRIEHTQITLKPQSGYKIQGFKFAKPDTGLVVPEKNIYFNLTTVQAGSQFAGGEDHSLASSPLEVTYDETSKTITVLKANYQILNDIVFPYDYDVVIQPGTIIRLGEKVSVIVQGGLKAVGRNELPIAVVRDKPDKAFGSFSVISNDHDRVTLSYFSISGGSEAVKVGVYFSGQMSVHNADISIQNSSFSNSESDDGINIKYSTIDITDSTFFGNRGDQIDLDFSDGVFEDNNLESKVTENIATDGLDLSGSRVTIRSNQFSGFSDKGISVGENSNVIVDANSIQNSVSGISIKDGSRAVLRNNIFANNVNDLDIYNKKKMYPVPSVILSEQGNDIKIGKHEGNVSF